MTMAAPTSRTARIWLWIALSLGAAGVATIAPAQPAGAASASGQTAAIERFFAAIDGSRIDEALALMNPELMPDTPAKKAWKRQFAVIRSIHVVEVREVEGTETDRCPEYKVSLDVRLAAGAAHAPIPNYGWDENRNVRWILLCPGADGAWLISSLGTGP
jgi:hypothetical protein